MAGTDIETRDVAAADNADTADKESSRKPDNSAFKQQRLRAWQPILTASTVLPVFFFIAVVFIPIGIGLLVSSSRVKEIVVPYTDCNSCNSFFLSNNSANAGKTCNCTAVRFELGEAFSGQVYVYYQLTNFYQNHRRYVRSRDDSQLHGTLGSSPASACKPFRDGSITLANNATQSLPIAPCGAIANSLFNDTIMLFWNESGTPTKLNLDHKNIAWKSDREDKFRNPSFSGVNQTLKDAFAKFTKPANWQRPVYELDPTDSKNNGFLNEDFIVWMRVAAFPTFRKLYRRIIHGSSTFKDGLPKGKYYLEIKYNYPVHNFEGTKAIVLSTTSWIGGKNSFLGTAYLTVGSICLVFGFIFLVIHMKVRTRPLRDWAPTTH